LYQFNINLFRYIKWYTRTTTSTKFIYCKIAWWSTIKKSTIWRFIIYIGLKFIYFSFYLIEINQQILDDQSAQNIPNNSDNKIDGEIQRSRSSITRNLLMNGGKLTYWSIIIFFCSSLEQNNKTSTTVTKARPLSPGFSKDFEYLIRRELDIEHAPSTLQRDGKFLSSFNKWKHKILFIHSIGSAPSVFQTISSIRNSPSANSQSPLRTKLKRKR